MLDLWCPALGSCHPSSNSIILAFMWDQILHARIKMIWLIYCGRMWVFHRLWRRPCSQNLSHQQRSVSLNLHQVVNKVLHTCSCSLMHASKLMWLQLLVPNGSHNDTALMAPLIPPLKNRHRIESLITRYELLPYLKQFDYTWDSLEIYLNLPAVMKVADIIGQQNMQCLRKSITSM